MTRGSKVHRANVESLRSILDLADRHPDIRRVVVRSFAVVYRVAMHLPVLVTEQHPLNLAPSAPQYVRDRVEADLTACARMGLVNAEIVVLRCAEALSPGTGSQLFDFLDAGVAMRPAGFDPMVNVATVADIVSRLRSRHPWKRRGGVQYSRLRHAAAVGGGAKVGHGHGALPRSLPCPRCTRSAIVPHRLRVQLRAEPPQHALRARPRRYAVPRQVLGYVPKHPVDWPVGGQVYQPASYVGTP